jgi:hypothetical protein
MLVGLLVKTNVEEPSIKELTDLIDKIATHFVIFRSREHTRVFSQPQIVSSGKIKLGYNLKSESIQSVKLTSHLILGEGALHRYLGVRIVDHSIAEIDDDSIAATGNERIDVFVP